MHIHKMKKLIKTALYTAIIAGAAGAATGTYAWYSYQKEINVDVTGTTIKADKEIQIGLRCKDTSTTEMQAFETKYTQYNEIEVETGVKFKDDALAETFTVYWIRGNYVTTILKDFQAAIHSAQNKLHPITAGKYSSGMEETIGTGDGMTKWNGFKRTPTHIASQRAYSGLVNNYEDYFYLPLAFRALEAEKDQNGDPQYHPSEEIFLKDFTATDRDRDTSNADDKDLAKALRVKVDYPAADDTSDNFIFDPNSSSDKNLKVGGILNMQPDIYYDFDPETMKEIAYGQFDTTVEWVQDKASASTNVQGGAALTDFGDCTTFLANHRGDTYAVDFSGNKSKASVCETKKSIVNTNFDAGKGIVKTDCYNDYGFVDLSIYLEGWDENIINVTAGRTFDVSLEFAIE